MLDDLNLIVDTPEKLITAKQYLSDLGDRPRLSIDTETCGREGVPMDIKPALRLNCVMLGVSISKNRKSGIFVPWFNSPVRSSIWNIDQLLEIREWLYSLFSDPKIGWVFHNSIFDLLVLRRHIGRPKNVVFDTQIAAHELDENRSLALKELGEAQYGLEAKAELNEMMAWAQANPDIMGSKPSKDTLMGQLWKVPLELYGKYAIQDTKITYALYEDFGRQLASLGMKDRYKFKNSLIPIYEEINSTGWAIDEQILVNAGKKMYEEVQGLFKTMYELLETQIVCVELETLQKAMPITATPTWKKRIIRKEGFDKHFTVPEFKLNRKGEKVPYKNAGSMTISQDYVDEFLALPESKGTLTAEFLKWDGKELSSLSEELLNELQTIQKLDYVASKTSAAKEDDKVPCPYVINFGSDQQISQVLFDKLGLPVLKRTEKADAPDVSEEVLQALKIQLAKEEGKESIVKFLECLLKLRELEKLYGTYVIGIQKRLYSHTDLKRQPEVNPDTGNVLKYCVSSINMTGTKTGRPSSSDPNQLNFPKDDRIKAAFVAPTGFKIGSADYDAQEVRQATNIAKDPDMKKVFTVICEKCGSLQPDNIRDMVKLDVFGNLKPLYRKEKDSEGNSIDVLVRPADTTVCCPSCGSYEWSEPDPHSLNASRIYPECRGLTLKEIKKKYNKTLRANAKVVQFQTLYGGTAAALSDALHITKNEAQNIQDAFFRGAPRIKAAIDRIINDATKTGFVETIGGYRRHLPDLSIEQLDYMKWPELDDEVQTWKCFSKVDHHPEIDDNGKARRMSNIACPREGKCKFKKECDHAFRRSMANKLQARAKRQAFNCQIQGDCADITNTALLNIAHKRAELSKLNPAWSKLKIISNIYDAIYLLVPEELCPRDPVNDPEEVNYLKVLKWAMENTYTDLYVPLTVELEAPAHSWADCH